MSTMTDDQKLDLSRRMFEAWDTMDWDAVVDLFADDGVLHSVMQEPVVGRAAIAERMAILGSKAERITLHVKALGIIDGRVFVERVDDFDFDGHHGEVPVVGILRMDDGKITEWLEYYDRPTLLAGMGITDDFGH
ncbi:nuclear transport factor 2 family protein [Aeromicrobium fastidiosum]|uniref:Nuclear transport factor 2 family protein n=1 Tax=Aeromicrobium fastidiosum TaxID=52699 RepID=A0A641ASA1_9ACTN|nr:nuclear transport factor 2 family protein [Aeromicrobium fastidiosum]KAA1380103.1 nuclear transport factor 2 family protein [Aeromicrobium fastidiosum]MBP2389634.1 limonene-1,2-epoxide hydrolase [Aeromicrobium fastidiosum]